MLTARKALTEAFQLRFMPVHKVRRVSWLFVKSDLQSNNNLSQCMVAANSLSCFGSHSPHPSLVLNDNEFWLSSPAPKEMQLKPTCSLFMHIVQVEVAAAAMSQP